MILELLASLLIISFVDAITTELYFKPKWRANPQGQFRNLYQIRSVVIFLFWYLAAFFIDKSIVIPQLILHIGGWEDFLYALWVPLFVKAEVAWEYEPGYKIGPWIFPYEWTWLGDYGGFWKFLSYNLLTLIGGKTVKLIGLIACMSLTALIVYIYL
jgi:hypothetical protein